MIRADFEELFGGKGTNSDFFEGLFGRVAGQQGNSSGAGQQYYQHSQPRHGQDQEHSVQLTLNEAFHGTKRVFEWEDGRKIDAKIPPGVKNGSRVRLSKGREDLELVTAIRGICILP